MESLQVKYLRKDAGKYTMIVNFEALSNSLRRPSHLVASFLQAKVEPQKCQLLKDGRLVISSKLGRTFLLDIVAEFVQHYVACPTCFSRDTRLKVDGRSELVMNCDGCGAESSVLHLLRNSVILALRLSKPSAESSMMLFQDPEASGELSLTAQQASSSESLKASVESQEKARPSLQDACEKLLIHGSHTESVMEAAQDIIAEFDLSSIELVPLLWFTLVKRASHYRSAIERHASLFRAAADLLVPYDASLLVLGCVEESLCTDDEALRKASVKAAPRILRTLFEQGVLDADTIVGWLDGSVRAVGSDLMGESLVPADVKAAVVKRSGQLLWAIREENPHVLPKIAAAADAETVDFEYLKLDIVKTKPLRPAPRQRTGDRSSGWQDLEEDDTIGNDWTFLEDALS